VTQYQTIPGGAAISGRYTFTARRFDLYADNLGELTIQRQLRRTARHVFDLVRAVTFEHAFADLGGVPASRLTDTQGLTGLLLARPTRQA